MDALLQVAFNHSCLQVGPDLPLILLALPQQERQGPALTALLLADTARCKSHPRRPPTPSRAAAQRPAPTHLLKNMCSVRQRPIPCVQGRPSP